MFDVTMTADFLYAYNSAIADNCRNSSCCSFLFSKQFYILLTDSFPQAGNCGKCETVSTNFMTRHFYIISVLTLGLCSCVGKTSNQTKIAPDLKSDYDLDTTMKFQFVREATYGYTFATPLTFIEQIDTIGQVDSIIYFSKDKEAKLIYFVEGDIHRQDTSKNYLYEYFHKLETGQHKILENCKILKSQLRYDNKWRNYRGCFVALGQLNEKQFVWKTQLSEVPVSGDLTYKTMLFIYSIKRQSYYQPIGVSLADNFSDPLR